MNKNAGSAKKEPASTTRIIPIQVEGSEPVRNSGTRNQSRKRDFRAVRNTTLPNDEEIETMLLSDDTTTSLNSTFQSDTTDLDRSVELDSLPERPIPPVYVPEKIIIILDRCLDDNFTHFEQKSGKNYNPLYMLQHAIQIFVNNKHLISADHEFALMTLNENSASWVHDFTSTPQDIISSLELVKPCKSEDIFNMNAIFDVICKHVSLPTMEGAATPFVVRAILLYDRSYTIPVLKVTTEISVLLQAQFFTFDFIMTHEPPDTDNHCNNIFEQLQRIDTKGFSYSFSVSRNSRDLHIAMAKILGHSLQRPPQSVLNYDISQFKM